MTTNINIINSVPVKLPEKQILLRLGFNRHHNVGEERQRAYIQQTINDGFALCRPRACWARIPILSIADGVIKLDGGTVFSSRTLAAMLKDSHAVWLAAGTVGPAIAEAVSTRMAAGDGAAAAILDAVGSETADAVLDWLQEYSGVLLTRTCEKLTGKRFSPGYSDLALTAQRDIFSLLQLERLGLSLTESMIIVPEKSVTAFAGIEKMINH